MNRRVFKSLVCFLLIAFVSTSAFSQEEDDEILMAYKGMLGMSEDPMYEDPSDMYYWVFENVKSEAAFKGYLKYIKENISKEDLLKSNKKTSILESSLNSALRLFSFYCKPEASNHQDYSEFLDDYLGYLISIGFDFDKKVSSPSTKGLAFFEFFFHRTSYRIDAFLEEGLFGESSIGDYYMNPKILTSRQSAIQALISNQFDLTSKIYGSSKYYNFYELRVMEALEHDGIAENVEYLDFLLKYYPDIQLFSGRSIYTQVMKQVKSATLNPKLYEVVLSNGFDANLPCEVCNGLTPLVMLGDLPNNNPLYFNLNSNKYLKGQLSLYETQNAEFRETDLVTNDDFRAPTEFLVEIAELLIKNGADVNENNNKFKTSPLHSAVRNGHPDLVKYLLENGAEKSLENSQGMTPSQVLDQMMKLLRESDYEYLEDLELIKELLSGN